MFPILMIGLLVLMIVMGNRSRKKMAAEQEEKQRRVAELTPGSWVRTTSGVWARFVEMDGDVVVLDNGSGNETYWDPRAISEITEPPFASTAEQLPEGDALDVADEDEHVFGLDAPSNDAAPSEDAADESTPDDGDAPKA